MFVSLNWKMPDRLAVGFALGVRIVAERACEGDLRAVGRVLLDGGCYWLK